jgi:peptide/nickel transport system substrate-binding protein
MKIFRHLLLIVVLSSVLFLAACGQGETTVPPTETKEVVVKPTDTKEPPTPIPPTDTPVPLGVVQAAIEKNILLDPANASNADSLLLCGQIYEGLVKLDAGGNPVPAIAASWTISDDKLDYIFHLSPTAVFADGSPVNADVVVANFNRWFMPDSALRFGFAYEPWLQTFLGFNGETNEDGTPKSFFDGIEKVDNFTVMIHLNKVNEDLLSLISQPAFAIANPAVILKDGDQFGKVVSKGAGSGPYAVFQWTDASLVLVPNEGYPNSTATEALEYPFK